MAIDSSIYFQQRPIDFLGNVQRGFEMADQMKQSDRRKAEDQRLAQEREQRAQVQQAYGLGLVRNPDGTTSYNANPVQSRLSELAGSNNPFAGEALYGMANTQYTRDQAEAQRKVDEDLRRQQIESAAADRKEARDERRFQSGLVRAERMDAKVDKEVQSLSKELSGVQEMTNALDEVEHNLGFPLSAATTKDGRLKVEGKEVDLPGVSIPLMGRVSAYNDKAQRLQSSAAKVFNTVLKDRSGAAVTNTELERLKTEFGEGKYNTEAQMVDALQRYQRALNKEMINREAGFSPSAVQRYSQQGGRTSKRISDMSPSDPINPVRVIAPDGSIRLIPKIEVQAALSAGGKLAE